MEMEKVERNKMFEFIVIAEYLEYRNWTKCLTEISVVCGEGWGTDDVNRGRRVAERRALNHSTTRGNTQSNSHRTWADMNL